MHETCHRCGVDLPTCQPDSPDGRASFCAHCGAPQLMLSDYAEPLSTGTEESAVPPGTLPAPRPSAIDWRLAIRSSAAVAAIAAILGVAGIRVPNLSPLSTIWIVSASLTTLALYQRRRPLASMNVGIGARIGMLVGVTLVFFLGTAMSLGMVVARFRMHALAGFDNEIAQLIRQLIEQIAAKQPIAPEQISFITSLQFRTGYLLFVFGIMLFLIFLMSVFGGAVAGLLRTRRTPVA